MTQQLMAFSRKRVLQTEVLNLNSVIAECEKLVRPMIGEDIHLVFIPGSGLGLVKADRGQLGQIIMNLVVNSRDAMPHGGTLTIETANVELDEADARAEPGGKTWSLRQVGGQGHRRWNGSGNASSNFRAVLYHQGGRERHWTGALDGLRNRQAERRIHQGPQ